MNAPTIIVLCILAVAGAAIIAVGLRNKKRGKHLCSCGGGCGSCNACDRAKCQGK